MRPLIALALLVAPVQALGSSHHACTAPLIVPESASAVPLPELEFTLSIADHTPQARRFVAQGQVFDGLTITPLSWTGSWTIDGPVLWMVGPVQSGSSGEWRARTVRNARDVMILNIDRGTGTPLMVRCLPREGA